MERNISDILSVLDDILPTIEGQKEVQSSQAEFRETFDTSKDVELWVELIAEEVYEFFEELYLNGRSDNLLKEYCDVIYVTEGLIGNSSWRVFLDIDDTDKFKRVDRRLNHVYDELLNVSKVGWQMFTTKEIMEGFRRVHESNMSKITADGKVLRREDGKVLKSDQYKEANMKGILDNVEKLKALRGNLV